MAQAAGLNILQSHDIRDMSIIPTQDYHALHLRNKRRFFNMERTPNVTCADSTCNTLNGTPRGYPWWKGSQWHVLGRHFVEYIFASPEVACFDGTASALLPARRR